MLSLTIPHIPQKTLGSRWKFPWLSNPIRRLIRKNRDFIIKLKGPKMFPIGENSDSRKLIKKQLLDAHNDYVSELLSFPKESAKSSKPVPTKRLWSYIRSKKSHDVGMAPLKE